MLLALFAGVFRYVDQHFHAPDTFLENTSELADNADVRERLLDGFRNEIVALAEGDVGEEAGSEAESERPDGLADPVTTEQNDRAEAIDLVLIDVFNSAQYDQTFQIALARTQSELIVAADLESRALLGNKGEVFFNMQPLYAPIYAQLAENPLTVDIPQPPPGYGVFKVADRDTTFNFLWTLLRNGPNWRGLAMLGAIASLGGAVFIADRRPSTAIQFGGGMVGVGIVLVVIIYLIRFVVPLLAGGGSSASAVGAVYAANLAPLVYFMLFRFVVLGVVISALGGIAKLIWPDDWVYSSVSDERGIRSIRRRRGASEAEQPAQQPPQQQLQPAAMAPGYGGYPQQYPGYPPQQPWGQPYPGQYPPGYQAPYPAGPYAQPAQPLPQSQSYTSPGKPTVPVMPVQVEQGPAGELIPPAAPPLDVVPGDLPADAAQAVPRVVATTDTTLDVTSSETPSRAAASPATPPAVTPPAATPSPAPAARETVVEKPAEPATGHLANLPPIPKIVMPEVGETSDSWPGEKDW